jgi:hypothetical protein
LSIYKHTQTMLLTSLVQRNFEWRLDYILA